MNDKSFSGSQQARVDAVFEAAKRAEAAAKDPAFGPKVLALAHRGLVEPGALSHDEISLICGTLISRSAADAMA